MALPLAGIAANLLLGAAIGAGISMFGGRDSKSASPTPKAQPSRSNAFVRPAWLQAPPTRQDTTATQPTPAQTIQVSQPRQPSPQALAKPEDNSDRAASKAAEIQRLPVFTPTAPTLSTTNYSSQRRADVQKTKAGDQMLRNPLAIDKDAASAAISSGLPSIGVSASGTNVANTGPSPIKKGNRNAR